MEKKELERLAKLLVVRRHESNAIEKQLKDYEKKRYSSLVVKAWKKFDYVDAKHIQLKESVVRAISVSLVDDIYRVQDYHEIVDGIDDQKKAAYLGKWVVKFKPLTYSNRIQKKGTTNHHDRVNEAFALQCMLRTVGSTQRISNKLLKELLYTLRYRHYSEAGITMLLRSLK